MGKVHSALTVYLREPVLAAAFVMRWRTGIGEGFYRIREDKPMRRKLRASSIMPSPLPIAALSTTPRHELPTGMGIIMWMKSPVAH